MKQFTEICFWADAGPHFRSAEFLHGVFLHLPQINSALYYMNYFLEHHGKSVVDGHFGVLARWHREGETNRYIATIDDLVALFRSKVREQAHSGGSNADTEFKVYSRDAPRDQIHRLVIQKFRSCMSFVMVNGVMLVSAVSTLNDSDYTRAKCRIEVVKDKRQTKYAPALHRPEVDVPKVMGPRSWSSLSNRMQLLLDVSAADGSSLGGVAMACDTIMGDGDGDAMMTD
jgi:hypothetical protein